MLRFTGQKRKSKTYICRHCRMDYLIYISDIYLFYNMPVNELRTKKPTNHPDSQVLEDNKYIQM